MGLNNDFEFSSSDSDGDGDDASVYSDISDLTGIFEEYPPEQGKKREKTSETSSDLSTTGHTLCSVLIRSIIAAASKVTSASKVSRSCSERNTKKQAISVSVSFSNVQVRQYERIMNYNPASAGGPSIGIGWRFLPDDPITLDDYELRRCSKSQRRQGELVMSCVRREKLIRSSGYCDREIASAVRELNRIRYQRRQTVNNLSMQHVEEAVESATRQVKKILSLERKSRRSRPSSLSPLSSRVPEAERVEL